MSVKPLAPVVREDGHWTYEAPPPLDFFSREAAERAAMTFYVSPMIAAARARSLVQA